MSDNFDLCSDIEWNSDCEIDQYLQEVSGEVDLIVVQEAPTIEALESTLEVQSDDRDCLASIYQLISLYHLFLQRCTLRKAGNLEVFQYDTINREIEERDKCLNSLKKVPLQSFLDKMRLQVPVNLHLHLHQSISLAALFGARIFGDGMEKSYSDAYMKDVLWGSITIVLYYCHLLETECSYKQIEASLVAISSTVGKEHALDVIQLLMNLLCSILQFVNSTPNLNAVSNAVMAALNDPVVAIPAIAYNAATMSLSEQLSMKNICKTLSSTLKKNTYTEVNRVLAIAVDVHNVSNTLTNLKRELFTGKSPMRGSKRQSSTTVSSFREEQPGSSGETSSSRMAKGKLQELMKVTDFNNITYSQKPIVTDKHSTSDFLKLFIQYNIVSNRQFYHILDIDAELKQLFLKIPYNITNHILNKGLSICQSQFKVTTLTDKMLTEPLDDTIEIRQLTGLVLQFLQQISIENGQDNYAFLDNIFNVLNLRDHKRITLCLIGQSNTGKTFLTQFLSAMYEEYEIGTMIPPHKDTLSEFWLSNCVYCSIKRCEEFFIPTVGVAAEFKKLLEGNTSLVANVKYKDNLNVPRTPVLITMNGTSHTDITKFCSNEYHAISNRCYIYMLNSPISQMRIAPYLPVINLHKRKIMKRLFELDNVRFLQRGKFTENLLNLNDLLEEEDKAIVN